MEKRSKGKNAGEEEITRIFKFAELRFSLKCYTFLDALNICTHILFVSASLKASLRIVRTVVIIYIPLMINPLYCCYNL